MVSSPLSHRIRVRGTELEWVFETPELRVEKPWSKGAENPYSSESSSSEVSDVVTWREGPGRPRGESTPV